MGKIRTDSIHYGNIAEAIRTKNGRTTLYKPGEMADAILGIQKGLFEMSATSENYCLHADSESAMQLGEISIAAESSTKAYQTAAQGWAETYDFVTFSDNGEPWIFEDDEKTILRSQFIGNSATSTQTLKWSGAGSISFYYRVSSYDDYLTITLDSTTIANIKGNTQFTIYSAELADGEHTLTLKYAQVGSDVSGDKGVIRDLQIIREVTA